MLIVGIILAAGKGKRLKTKDRNKVTLPFLNKPLIVYSVELMQAVCDKTVVVVGAFAETIKQVFKNKQLIYAFQKDQLGTADATRVGLEKITQLKLLPDLVLVGYADHMMFYKKETIKKLIDIHRKNQPSISLLTFKHQNPDQIKHGRIVRNSDGLVVDIVEQKDATFEQRLIKEVNPGFYCFDFSFLRDNIDKIKKSLVSGEYYITDMVKIAVSEGKKIVGLLVDFHEVGLGINTAEELTESEKIYLQKK